jgi:hypothetical protein
MNSRQSDNAPQGNQQVNVGRLGQPRTTAQWKYYCSRYCLNIVIVTKKEYMHYYTASFAAHFIFRRISYFLGQELA